MRRIVFLSLAVTAGMALMPARAGETASWQTVPGLTSASLATIVASPKLRDGDGKRWELLSSTSSALPSGELLVVTFFRVDGEGDLDAEAVYRCLDRIDPASGETRAASCATPRL
ncbi:MAG: hypothetical protein R3D70_24425 [Rhizobiaceae bacterium]